MHPGNKRYSGTLMVTPRACKPLSVRTSITDLCDPALRYAQQRPGATGNGSAKWEDPEQASRSFTQEGEANLRGALAGTKPPSTQREDSS